MSADALRMSPKSSPSDEVGDSLNSSASESTLFESSIETSTVESKATPVAESTPKKKTSATASTRTTTTKTITKTRPVSSTNKLSPPAWRTTGVVSSSPYSAFGGTLPRLAEKTVRSRSTPRTSTRSSADSSTAASSSTPSSPTSRIKRSQDTDKLIAKVPATPKINRERRSAGESRISSGSSTTQGPKIASNFAPLSPPASPAKKKLVKKKEPSSASNNNSTQLPKIVDEKEPQDMNHNPINSSPLTVDGTVETPYQYLQKLKQQESHTVTANGRSEQLLTDSEATLSPISEPKPAEVETHIGVPTAIRHESGDVNMFKQSRPSPDTAESKPMEPILPSDAVPKSIYQHDPESVLQPFPPVIQRPKYKLDDFHIMNTLGTGSFGRVHLVKMKTTGKFYALKVLKKSEIVKLRQVEHTINEKSILEMLDCRFIVNLYGTFSDCSNLYFLMDFVAGGELFSYLRRSGRFPDQVAKFYAAEVVLAFEYLHSKDVIYRDLKPENLLLDASGHIKITDFGFAKLVPDVTWTLCGTPDYLAPEIIHSKGYGRAVDWWALGVLIYEMLAGHPPFFDEDHFKLYEKILACKLRFPSHFDPYAKDLVKRLLQPDLTKRYGNLKDGALDIKRHKWFTDVNWEKLSRWEVKVPYQPKITHDGDSSNFDQYPEDHEPYGGTGPDPYREKFKDF